MVGGRTPFFSANVVKIASTAPAAPRQWPVAPLVDDTGVRYAFSSPSASFRTRVSAESPDGVDVPWAFTYPTTSGSIAASANAIFIARAGFAPVGPGSETWLASA